MKSDDSGMDITQQFTTRSVIVTSIWGEKHLSAWEKGPIMRINEACQKLAAMLLLSTAMVSAPVYGKKGDQKKSIPNVVVTMAGQSTLEYFDVQCEQLSQQMIIKSSKAITCKKQLDAEKHQFILDIQGLTINNADKEMIKTKAQPLKEQGCLQEVSFDAQTPGSTRLIFTFVPHKLTKELETGNMVKTKNKFLIRSCAYKRSFTIDIFTEEALQKIVHKDSFIKLAANDIQYSDYGPPIAGMLTKPLRIMIDVGHGGADLGASSHNNLLEKEVTLAIGKEVHKLLKESGHQVYLTRYSDIDLSLAQRTSLATQFKTDFMVSIHANSSGKPLSQASGLETYYFPAKELQSKETLDFMFVNHPKDMGIINELQKGVRTMVHSSYNLAKTIHESVLSTVGSQHGPIQNRGVKADFFRLFIKNHIPCALVEVGFLTNREEAEKLATKKYRLSIAQGIAAGIRSFINTDFTKA